MDRQHEATIESIARILRDCRSVMFVTGAGISADSGVPTYRGIGGLYDIDVTEEGYPIEEVLSSEMLHAKPELTWKYLGQIADAARGATFNRGHQMIAAMEKHFDRVWTLTQNVDGFHRAAGSENVIEIHGNMRSLSCMSCSAALLIDGDEEIEIPPHCRECDSILRPDVVLFGETLPDGALTRLQSELDKGFDIVFSIGTSSIFPYIQAPIAIGKQQGMPTVEINPTATSITRYVDYYLPMGAAEALEDIWTRYSAG